MKLKLTNGTVIEPALNQVGQVILGKTFPGMDYCEAAELLDAAPCDIRYGMVHPGSNCKEVECEKPTPGPWSMSRDAVPPGHVQITIYAEASGQRVATAFEREANAALIAAAPDLLQACRMILRWIEMENQDNPEIEELTLSTVGEHVEAAIARAEGKEAAR